MSRKDLAEKRVEKLGSIEQALEMKSDEVNRVAMDILNVKSQIENRREYRDLCDSCDHKSCRDCDGRSKFKERGM